MDGIDKSLSQSKQFSSFSYITHINTGRILKPDDRNPITPTLGHKLIHLDQALAVQFSTNPRIICIFGIPFAQVALPVTNTGDQEPIHFTQTGVHFRTVIRSVFHMFTLIYQAGQDLIKLIDLFRFHG